MKLEMIGLNHTTSNLAIRDRAAIGPDRISDVAFRLLQEEHVEGVVILSTCNRTEIYLSPNYHLSNETLRYLFAEVCRLTNEEAAAGYIYRDEDAVNHLHRVASGLDSQLLGEIQILAQVKDAYHAALTIPSSNALLNRVFLHAIECGKLVRHRTAISQGAVSVAHAAVELAKRVFGELDQRNILLVGAGNTIQLAARHITKSSNATWKISNRTRANAESLAEFLNGVATSFPPTPDDIKWADIVISATNSPDTVITGSDIAAVLTARKTPLLFLDLAVPRDVDPDLKRGANTYIYSVDDFTEMVKANLKTREREAVRAEKLVEKQGAEFSEWYKENRISPTIQQLREVLEEIRSSEVENNLRRFCPQDRAQVEKFSKALMNKVTSLIIVNMKHASLTQNDLSLARAISMAFATSDDSSVKDVLEQLKHELSH